MISVPAAAGRLTPSFSCQYNHMKAAASHTATKLPAGETEFAKMLYQATALVTAVGVFAPKGKD